MAERAALSPSKLPLVESICELVQDKDETTTPYAGLFDDQTNSVKDQIGQRMKLAAAAVPQFDDFPWECHNEILIGVPLKHVVDHFFSKTPICNHDKTDQEPIFRQFMAQGGNFNMEFEPEEPWSLQWTNWSERYEPKDMPLRHVQVI